MGRSSVDALIFDLDGTLVNSVPDLAAAVNFAMSKLGRPPKTESQVAVHVGNGVRVLLTRVMENHSPVSEDLVDRAQKFFEEHYRAHCLDKTVPYPGVKETLNHFSSVPKAVVTNKPEEFTRKILEGLGIVHQFAAVLGGDSFPIRKPRPEPLWEAARRLKGTQQKTLMVGDSSIDIDAGRAAGMVTCAVSYGLTPKKDLESAQPDHLIDQFSQLKDIIL